MKKEEINLMEKMQELKREIRERYISERLENIDYSNITNESMKEIYDEVDENIKINVKYLGNPEKGDGFFEVIIDNDGTINYEYYNNSLEKVAEEKDVGDMELVGKYRDRLSILEQIEDLREKDSLSLEELENIKKVAEKKGINVDELDELDLNQEIKSKEEQENNEPEEEISATKQDELKGYVKQEMETSQLIDGRETLAKRLGLEEYSKIYIVYSHNVDKVQNEEGTKNERNNTTYSLIGVREDGTAKVLSDSEFEIDKNSGINPKGEKSVVQNDDNTTEITDNIVTRYKRVGSQESLSISQEEQTGTIKVYFEPGRTKEENMSIGTEVETPQTKREYEGGIEVQTRRIISKEHGINNLDNVQDEVEEELKTDKDGKLTPEQADGKDIITAEYIDTYIENAIEELLENEDINDVFTRKEIENKLSDKIYLSDISTKDDLDKIKANVKWEMSVDAEMYKEHGRSK